MAAGMVDQRVQKVNIDVEVLGDEAHDDVNPIPGPLKYIHIDTYMG